MNRRLTWLLTVPLMVGSLLAGHTVAYRLVDAPSTGHGYFHYVPLVGAVLLALALCALVLEAVAVLRGEVRVSSPPWAFALLPLGAFVIQEHLERLLYSGTSPVLEPAFLVGLAVQLPFGVVALLLARVLQSLAQRSASLWPCVSRLCTPSARLSLPSLSSPAGSTSSRSAMASARRRSSRCPKQASATRKER